MSACKLLSYSCRLLFATACVATFALPTAHAATAQPGYPVPQIVGPTNPTAVAPGGAGFTLRVFGANFINGSVVNWNASPRATTFVSGHELDAQVLAADIASNTAGMITVTITSPNGPITSSTFTQVEVHSPIAAFGATRAYSVPQYSSGGPVLVGDINNDGILDFAAGTQLTGYFPIQSFFGEGDGKFTSGPYEVFNWANGAAMFADLNGDGRIDLVEMSDNFNGTDPHIQVSLGNGDGTFTPVFTFAPGVNSSQVVAVGDFDRDGILDLVLGSTSATRVYLGNGDGTFHKGSYIPMDSGALFPLLGDVNGDGILDVIAFVLAKDGKTLQVRVALGNGDGTFQKARTAGVNATNSAQGSLHLTDFNGDGVPDLYYYTGTQAAVSLGRGDGTFKPPTFYTPTGLLHVYGAGDMNSDGKVDLLVTTDIGGSIAVSVLPGNGDGTFGTAYATTAPTDEPFVIPADFNADGLMDIAIVGGVYIQ